MAQVVEDRKRGRKKGLLRTTASQLVAGVGKSKKAIEETMELLPATEEFPVEMVTVTIPKGAVVIPFGLTFEKSDENAREQIRKGAEDGGIQIAIKSFALKLDRDGSEKPLWYLAVPEAEAK